MGNNKRKLVAIGDLHGDFYRLIRILMEQEILDPETLKWKPSASHCDVILLGDYIDWRGEPLEGPYNEWPDGARRILEFISTLSAKGGFYPLLGNHDEMMLQGHSIMKKLSHEKNMPLNGFTDSESWVELIGRAALSLEEEEDYLRFMNWYEQGGERTIASFGSLHSWLSAIEGEIGDFLRRLPIGVAVNGKLFSHTVPDEPAYWVPIHELQHPDERVRQQFLWGRKIWGYDAFMGIPTRPLSEGDVDVMLERIGVKGVVVGHTSLRKSGPYLHFGGKVINVDTHGIPGSQAFVEEYVLEGASSGPARRKPARFKLKARGSKRHGRH